MTLRILTILALLAGVAGCAGAQQGPIVEKSTSVGSEEMIPQAPEWKVGDRWVFRKRVGLSEGRSVRTVTEASLAGYLVRVDENRPSSIRWHHLTSQIEVVGWTEDDLITEAYSPPLPLFQWPLKSGLRWVPQVADSSTCISLPNATQPTKRTTF